MLGGKPFWMTWNWKKWEGEPLKFSSQRILRQSVVRGKKCLAVSARHHHIDPGGFCYIIPTLTQIDFCAKCFGHCKEGSFWRGVFPASQCVTVFGFNTSAYPAWWISAHFCPCSTSVSRLSIKLCCTWGIRESPAQPDTRNGFSWNSRGASFSVTSLEFRKLWAAVKVKSKGLRMSSQLGETWRFFLFLSFFRLLEFLRLLEWPSLCKKLLCADFCGTY